LFASDEFRYLFSRLIDSGSRSLPTRVRAGCVGLMFSQEREHGLQHFGYDGRGRVVVEIDHGHTSGREELAGRRGADLTHGMACEEFQRSRHPVGRES
jgi:hypothetical protein